MPVVPSFLLNKMYWESRAALQEEGVSYGCALCDAAHFSEFVTLLLKADTGIP